MEGAQAQQVLDELQVHLPAQVKGESERVFWAFYGFGSRGSVDHTLGEDGGLCCLACGWIKGVEGCEVACEGVFGVKASCFGVLASALLGEGVPAHRPVLGDIGVIEPVEFGAKMRNLRGLLRAGDLGIQQCAHCVPQLDQAAQLWKLLAVLGGIGAAHPLTDLAD